MRAKNELAPYEKRKKESAREKDGTHIAFFTEPHPGSRRTGPPDDDGGILANCRLRVAVSAPNFVRKYACCSHFQILQNNRAATPETTMQQKMKEYNAPEKKLSSRISWAGGNCEKEVHTCTLLYQRK